MEVRNYNPDVDYPGVEALYRDSSTFGGQFDAARDTKAKLDQLERSKPGSILVAEHDGQAVGSVTLFEDGRAAWLYRFAVQAERESEIAAALWTTARQIAKQRGHVQVLLYAPAGNQSFEQRYAEMGFTKGENYTAYWQDV